MGDNHRLQIGIYAGEKQESWINYAGKDSDYQ